MVKVLIHSMIGIMVPCLKAACLGASPLKICKNVLLVLVWNPIFRLTRMGSVERCLGNNP